MRILQINKYLYPRGGSESYLFALSESLEKYGHNVEFWGMKDEKNICHDTYDCFAEKIDFKSLNPVKKLVGAPATIYSIRNRKKIAVILDKFLPDLVHIHNYNFQLTPSILPEIKRRGIKIIYTAHDSQLACPYHRLYNFQADKKCIKCESGRFYNCVKDRCFDGSIFKSLIGATESYFYHNLNYYNKHIDAVVSPSRFMAGRIKKLYNKDINIIPNFFDTKFTAKNIKQNYILFFGRISSEKGLAEILPYFSKLEITLKIVGDGPDVDKLNVSENIQYMGPKYGDELLDIIAGARFVIQPSKGYENCPMAVIESLSCGTPVIAANHSGFKEIIDHGTTGLLLDFNDVDWVEVVRSEFKNYKKDWFLNCMSSYKKNYTRDIHVSKIINLYESILYESL